MDRNAGTPRVSVVLPTWNRAHMIERAVASVLAQTFSDFELVVVDDASTDSTRAVVAAIADPRLRVHTLPENRGPAAARNAGIDLARGNFVAFHDSDDEWFPHKLARHLEVFGEHPGASVTHSDMVRVHEGGGTSRQATPDVRPGCWVDRDRGAYQTYGLGVQAAVLRRSCFEGNTRFDESLRCFEDLELFQRLSRKLVFVAIHEPLVRYYEGPGVSTHLGRHLAARRRLLFRWMPHLLPRHPWFVAREFLKVHKGLLALPATDRFPTS